MNEPPIEVGEAKAGLNVLDILEFGPILNSLDFVVGYGEPRGREDITKIFHGLRVPFTFLQFEVKPISAKVPENFPGMFAM